jgi:3-oxoacyl-[acyl-carrier protein] reductase
MIEKGATGNCQFRSLRAAIQELNANFLVEIADLTAEGRLGGVKPFFGGERQASRLGNSDEIPKVAKFHGLSYLKSMAPSLQSLFKMHMTRAVYPDNEYLVQPVILPRQDGRTMLATHRNGRLRALVDKFIPKTQKVNFMTKKLEGKIALVTGGSRGIGAAIAKRLAADGAKVAITYTKGADAAASVVKTIEGAGGKAIAIQADATDPDAVKAAIEKTVATFGGFDVLVNNAGTAIPNKFEEATLEELDRVININIRGTFIATQAALKHMKKGGRIISIGSCVGERMMTPGLAAYAATKGAIKMFTQGLSREVGDRGITVNNIQPGPIDTELNPAAGEWAVPQKANTALNRYGSVDDIAAMVAFVAGPEASYITGTSLTVDGGTNA